MGSLDNDNMEGTYKLENDDNGKCGLRVKEEGDKLRVSVKVANSMNVVLRQEGDKWVGGPVMSTKMMPVPALESLEKEMSDLLSNISDIRREGNSLVLQAGDKKAVFLSE